MCVVRTQLNWIELYKKKSTGITGVAGKISTNTWRWFERVKERKNDGTVKEMSEIRAKRGLG